MLEGDGDVLARDETKPEPEPKTKHTGTKLWLTNPHVAACPKDGCFWDAADCPEHRTKIAKRADG